MFLSFTPLESLSAEERYVLATDMALASITGEETYNFGEVIATPILSSLQNTPNAWMFELVHVLNRGDIDQFNQLVDTHRAQYSAQPSLTGRHEMVKQKVVLLSLVNIAFERPSHDRQISFADIAAVTKIPLNQVSIAFLPSSYLMCILAAGGVGADARHVAEADQGYHRRGGRLGECDVGAAPRAGQATTGAAGQSAGRMDGAVSRHE
jgi:26S proteasome regulatory subunit N9